MTRVGNSNSKKSVYGDASPLSPPWTTAVVFLLIVFFVMLLKISISG